MFKKLSSNLVNTAIQRDVIDESKTDEHIFGLNAFFTVIFNIISAMVIGVIMNMLFETVLFIITYKLLRKYLGGGHSKTSIRCYISSCITYIIALISVKYYPFSVTVTTLIVIICVCIMFILAPVEAEKKPLDDIERVVFKHRARITIVICVIIFLLLHYVPYIPYGYYCSVVIVVSIIIVTIFLIEGKMHLILR